MIVTELESAATAPKDTTRRHRERTMKANKRILKTGIFGLDLALNGGLPLGSSVLLHGPTGMGKTILALQLSHNIVKNGGTVGYLSTEQRVDDLVSQANALGWDLDQYRRTRFIVADNLPKIHKTFDLLLAPDDWDSFDIGPADTRHLDSWASWFKSELEKRGLEQYDLVIIDPIHTFLDQNKDKDTEWSTREMVTRFESLLSDKCELILFITNRVLADIESLFDGVLEVETKFSGQLEAQKMMRIKEFRKIKHEINWIPYYILEAQGIRLNPPIPLAEFYNAKERGDSGLFTSIEWETVFKSPLERITFPISACLNLSYQDRILVEITNGYDVLRAFLYFASQQSLNSEHPMVIFHASDFKVMVPEKPQNPHDGTLKLEIRSISSLENEFVKVVNASSLEQLGKQLINQEENSITIVVDFESFLLPLKSHENQHDALYNFLQRMNDENTAKTVQMYFVNQTVLEPRVTALLEHFMDDVLIANQSGVISEVTVKKSLLPPKFRNFYLK